MGVKKQHLFSSSGNVLICILFVLLGLLSFLNAQNCDTGLGENKAQFQCLASVGKCLSSCAWQISETQESSCQPLSTNEMHQYKTQLISEMWATYGNFTERMGELCRPQPEILQKLKDLHVQMQGCQNKPDNSIYSELFDGIQRLKDKLEALTAAHKGTEDVMLAQGQLGECKESLVKSQTETNRLRRLVRERYGEGDLVSAARSNDLDRLRDLLDAGFRVDSRDRNYYSNTPLHAAAVAGHLEVIEFLVERGAPLEARNNDNNTPLIDSAVGGQLLAAQLLIKLGANPLARGKHGTARERAIRDGKLEVANWLKEKGW